MKKMKKDEKMNQRSQSNETAVFSAKNDRFGKFDTFSLSSFFQFYFSVDSNQNVNMSAFIYFLETLCILAEL